MRDRLDPIFSGVRIMNRFLLSTAVAVGTMMAASSASALSLQYDGSVKGFQTVSVAGPGFSRNVLAGAYKMKDITTNKSLVVLCMDILASVSSGVVYPYKATNTPFSNSAGLSNGAVSRLQALFDSSYRAALTSIVNSAGFQVAAWNVVYDNDWTVDSGSFQQGGSSAAKTAANTFLTAASNHTGGKKFSLTFLESTLDNRSQNLVTVAAVPLPAAGLMLIGAIGGLFAARRRKKA